MELEFSMSLCGARVVLEAGVLHLFKGALACQGCTEVQHRLVKRRTKT